MKNFRKVWIIFITLYGILLSIHLFFPNIITQHIYIKKNITVNTIFNIFLLLGSSLIFSICILCRELENKKEYYFYLLQIILFTTLGIGYFFEISQIIYNYLKVSLFIIIITLTLLELIIHFSLTDFKGFNKNSTSLLFIGLVFIFIFLVIGNSSKIEKNIKNIIFLIINSIIFLYSWTILVGKLAYVRKRGHYITDLIVKCRTKRERPSTQQEE